MTMSVIAPEKIRISVNDPASMCPSSNAMRHKMELAAKASIATKVKSKVFTLTTSERIVVPLWRVFIT